MSIALYGRFESMRTKAFGDVAVAYSAIGTPLDYRSSILYLHNTTDKDVVISFDGTNDNFYLPTGAFYPLTIGSNSVSKEGLFIRQGTTVYVKRSAAGAPGSGSVYVTSLYATTTGIKE